MNMIDLGAMLTDAFSTPVVALFCVLCIFAAGAMAGAMARNRHEAAHHDQAEAGDTQRDPFMRRLIDDGIAHTAAHPTAAPRPRPHLRAIGASLKPSYDGRAHRRGPGQPDSAGAPGPTA